MFFFKNLCPVRILTSIFLAVSLLFTACEQPGGSRDGNDKVLPDRDATLKTLTVDSGTLSPAFSADHSEYRVTVRNEIDSITVTATANSAKSSISGTGTKTLNVGGGNIITVDVTAAETDDSKTYTITVTRLDGSVKGIATAGDMAKIGVDDDWPLEGEYALLNDITLENWSPIGGGNSYTGVGAFSGIFDGHNHTITLKSLADAALNDNTADTDYLGIFGYVKGVSASAKAEIKNLTINSTINHTLTRARNTSVGLLASRAETAVVIEDITLTGTLTLNSTHRLYLGGVVGIINGSDVVVKNCNSSLKMDLIPGGGGAGGTALVPATGDTYVGGIVGYFNNGAGIVNCHNTGDITADNLAGTGNGQIYVGGITGGSEYNFSTTYKGYIKDSSYIGNIIGKARGSWVFVGGIAGTIVGGNVNDNAATTRIERCFAKGTMYGTAGFPYIGGVVGYNYYGALVSQSYFDGKVITDKTNDYTGGIAGYNSQTTGHNSRIEDCWSGGTVTGFNNAGGIVGVNQTQTYIRRSYSRAALSITDTTDKVVGSWAGGVGGIAGFNASMLSDAITACVALNPSLNAAQGSYIQRVVGRPTTTSTGDGRSNNHAWSGMAISTGGAYTEAKGANNVDGADCVQKPNQDFYADIGWDFDNVWKMGADGYPQLKWQK